MTYGAVDLPDAWGVDSAYAGALTDEQLKALAEQRLPTPTGRQACQFLWMYAPLAGSPASKWDASAERMRAACDAGLTVLLVQHCRRGSWTASAEQGKADGEWAANVAKAIGYPGGAHLALDLESVANSGTPVTEHVEWWCDAVSGAAQPCLYVGFSPGLTPNELWNIPNVNRYWGAAGNWGPSIRGVCARQYYPPVTVGGVQFDLDHAHPDQLGGVLRGMARVDAHVETADLAA